MLKIAFHPNFVLPLPKGHRFPMEKYELVPQQLLHEGTCSAHNFFTPSPPDIEDILAVHDREYVERLQKLALRPEEVREIGLPLSQELVQREFLICQGTIMAAQWALTSGIAMNVAGGTHHAYKNRGEGFCLLNDQAVAAKWLQRHSEIKKILIIDLDVHQGNGTAQIFDGDESVFTFSMHGRHNFPFEKERSDLDIALDSGMEDDQYLDILKEVLPDLITTCRPDFIFYLSGVDILKTDKLGKLSCSKWGCKERDRYVLQTCRDENVPVQVSMGGGYSTHIKTTVEAHANTFRVAQNLFF